MLKLKTYFFTQLSKIKNISTKIIELKSNKYTDVDNRIFLLINPLNAGRYLARPWVISSENVKLINVAIMKK